MPRGGTPNEHGDNLAVFKNELAEAIARFPPSPQKVFFIQKLMSDFPIGGSLRDGNLECGWFCAGSFNGRICIEVSH